MPYLILKYRHVVGAAVILRNWDQSCLFMLGRGDFFRGVVRIDPTHPALGPTEPTPDIHLKRGDG
jgi:hypothetical protein